MTTKTTEQIILEVQQCAFVTLDAAEQASNDPMTAMASLVLATTALARGLNLSLDTVLAGLAAAWTDTADAAAALHNSRNRTKH